MRTCATLLLILALAVSGCASSGATGATMISVDRMELALALGDAKAEYAVIADKLAEACVAGKLSETACARLGAGKEKAELIYKQIRKALLAPPAKGGATIDMEQLGEYLGVILKMAGKAAL